MCFILFASMTIVCFITYKLCMNRHLEMTICNGINDKTT